MPNIHVEFGVWFPDLCCLCLSIWRRHKLKQSSLIPSCLQNKRIFMKDSEAVSWRYPGLVPKVICRHKGEQVCCHIGCINNIVEQKLCLHVVVSNYRKCDGPFGGADCCSLSSLDHCGFVEFVECLKEIFEGREMVRRS